MLQMIATTMASVSFKGHCHAASACDLPQCSRLPPPIAAATESCRALYSAGERRLDYVEKSYTPSIDKGTHDGPASDAMMSASARPPEPVDVFDVREVADRRTAFNSACIKSTSTAPERFDG
jgi:hypothetical protein